MNKHKKGWKSYQSKKIICFSCEAELTKQHFENDSGEMSLPVCFFQDIKDVKKYYKELTGKTYLQNTGIKAEDDFHKEKVELSHLSIDDYSMEQIDKHTFGKIECWVN